MAMIFWVFQSMSGTLKSPASQKWELGCLFFVSKISSQSVFDSSTFKLGVL